MLIAGGLNRLTSISYNFEFLFIKSYYGSQTLVQRPLVKREIALSTTKVFNYILQVFRKFNQVSTARGGLGSSILLDKCFSNVVFEESVTAHCLGLR